MFKFNNVFESGVGSEVCVANHKSCLVFFYLANHFGLTFNRLRAKNKRYSAVFGKRDSHIAVRHRLHNSRCKGRVERDGWFFAFLEFYKRRAEVHIVGSTFLGGESGYQEILVKSS